MLRHRYRQTWAGAFFPLLQPAFRCLRQPIPHSLAVVLLLAGAARTQAGPRDVLPRLRCQACHDRPATVVLIENPAGQAHGVPPVGWAIILDEAASPRLVSRDGRARAIDRASGRREHLLECR